MSTCTEITLILNTAMLELKLTKIPLIPGGGGGGLSYERGGDARRKFQIEPLKETNLGMTQAFFFFTPERDHFKTQTNIYFYISLRVTLNETFTAKYKGVLPRGP